MRLEFNLPKFKITELGGKINPLTPEGVRALGIVLAAIVVISGAVYSTRLITRKESTVLPAQTEVEVTPQPTVALMPTLTPTLTPTAATPSAIPTEAAVEVWPEVPTATASPMIEVIISPVETYPTP